MIPALPARPVDLRLRILKRYAPIPNDTRLQADFQPAKQTLPLHGATIQLPSIGHPDPQLFHGGSHGIILAFQRHLMGAPLSMVLELRRAMDGPVPQGTQAGEAQRPWV
jgi:hypothetical protein